MQFLAVCGKFGPLHSVRILVGFSTSFPTKLSSLFKKVLNGANTRWRTYLCVWRLRRARRDPRPPEGIRATRQNTWSTVGHSLLLPSLQHIASLPYHPSHPNSRSSRLLLVFTSTSVEWKMLSPLNSQQQSFCGLSWKSSWSKKKPKPFFWPKFAENKPFFGLLSAAKDIFSNLLNFPKRIFRSQLSRFAVVDCRSNGFVSSHLTENNSWVSISKTSLNITLINQESFKVTQLKHHDSIPKAEKCGLLAASFNKLFVHSRNACSGEFVPFQVQFVCTILFQQVFNCSELGVSGRKQAPW